MTAMRMELVCPAGSLPALKAALAGGADAIYAGFQDGTNARAFAGLNFTTEELREGIVLAHRAGARVFIAINVYPSAAQWDRATRAVDRAVESGADALIIADLGLLDYARERHPQTRLHLSVQSSATSREALSFYAATAKVQRAVLPRVLSVAQIADITAHAPLEIEVFGFGSLCVMAEGRCFLSSYVTGESPNTAGVCSPARAVRWEEGPQGRQVYLNRVLIDRFADGAQAGYPTLCKGRFCTGSDRTPRYALEEPTSLNVLSVLPDLLKAGVRAIKVEGRQRSPAYVGEVTRVLRAALDSVQSDPERYRARAEWMTRLASLAEGRQVTLGALDREWQ